MIVIADSGSTKADWVIAGKEKDQTAISTIGFNPVFHSPEQINKQLKIDFKGKLPRESVSAVYYYGAGCWDDHLKSKVRVALDDIFVNAPIHVEHDLLGAARATCGHEPGISCILGTGSNSCLYDGTKVIDNITNLGYLVGDEGSGSFLGKMLIRSYFYREMPPDLARIFEEQFSGGKTEILDKIYQGTSPNVYLASFARFMSDHKKHFFIEKMVYDGFSEFVDRNVRKYAKHLHIPVHFIGSVAYHFNDILRIVLEERCLLPGKIIKKPIHNLVKYHLEAAGSLKSL